MNTLFTANMIINLIFGIGFAVFPSQMINMYGVKFTEGGYFMTRMFGSALLATVALLWYVRGSHDQGFTNGSARSMFVYWVLGSIFILIAQFAGLFNWVAWGTFGFHAIFAIWYGYKLFLRP